MALAVLAGCNRPTAYAPADPVTTYGYTDEKIDATTWRVHAAGNNATSRERVESMLLYRGAELAASQNAERFFVLDTRIERDPSFRGMAFPVRPYSLNENDSSSGRPLPGSYSYPYSPYGNDHPRGTAEELQPVDLYTGHATIRVFRETPPENLGAGYQTAEVLSTLAPAFQARPAPDDDDEKMEAAGADDTGDEPAAAEVPAAAETAADEDRKDEEGDDNGWFSFLF